MYCRFKRIKELRGTLRWLMQTNSIRSGSSMSIKATRSNGTSPYSAKSRNRPTRMFEKDIGRLPFRDGSIAARGPPCVPDAEIRW